MEELDWLGPIVVGPYVVHVEGVEEGGIWIGQALFASAADLADLFTVRIPIDYAAYGAICAAGDNRVYIGKDGGPILAIDTSTREVVGEISLERPAWSNPTTFACIAFQGRAHFLTFPSRETQFEDAPFLVTVDPASDTPIDPPIPLAVSPDVADAATFFAAAGEVWIVDRPYGDDGFPRVPDGVERVDLEERVSNGLSLRPEDTGIEIGGVVVVDDSTLWYGIAPEQSARIEPDHQLRATAAAAPPANFPARSLRGPGGTLFLRETGDRATGPYSIYRVWDPCGGRVLGSVELPVITDPFLLP